MGWWKIADVETGMVDFKAKTAAQTANAVPGHEDTECLFNGDGPADIMGDTLRRVSALYQSAWGRPAALDELRACFNFCLNGLARQRAQAQAQSQAHEAIGMASKELGLTE